VTSLSASRRLLAGCDDSQVEAITSPAAPLCVIAPAGSGKTRVLTRRIAWRIEQASAHAPHVLALTFTRKAATELRDRLALVGVPLSVHAGTFHAIAFRTLRRLAAETSTTPPVLLDHKGRLLGRLVGQDSRLGRANDRSLVLELASEIEWAKARMIPPDGYVAAAREARRVPSFGPERVAELYARYEAEKRRRKVADFDDVLSLLIRRIETDPAVASSLSWHVRHLFVDEFQDLNPLQLRLLEALLAGRTDLFMVGDPDQAIYAWNGAEADPFGRFLRSHPDAATLRLTTNYRSTPEILAAAATLLEDRAGSPPLQASRPSGPIPTTTAYDSDEAEVSGVIAGLRRAHRPGRSWSQMAILARTNAQLLAFEAACAAARIPVARGSGDRFLDTPVVARELRLAHSGEPPPLPALIERWNAAGGDDGALGALHAESDGPSPSLSPEEAGALSYLATLCQDYIALEPGGSVASFSAWLRLTLGSESAPRLGDAVDCLSFHRAKGLEWDVVFVTGLEEGLVPLYHASSRAALAEEQRLLYVALTRAVEELHCSYAISRRFGARLVEREPSHYLAPIGEILRDLARERRPVTEAAQEGIARSRVALATSKEVPSSERPSLEIAPLVHEAPVLHEAPVVRDNLSEDNSPGRADSSQLLAAIERWRDDAARAACVPITAILPDRTVRALVADRPDTLEDLAALPGIGAVRVERLGGQLIHLLRTADRSPSSEPGVE